VSIAQVHQLSVQLTSEALKELLPQQFQKMSTDVIAAQHTKSFYWHSVAHSLGLDTHDVAMMGFSR